MARRSNGHCFQYSKGTRGNSCDVNWIIQSGRGEWRSGRLVLEGTEYEISNASTKPSTGWMLRFNVCFGYFPAIKIEETKSSP